jgi:DNA-binding transcriptional regulator YdaS (Cro superfamily)
MAIYMVRAGDSGPVKLGFAVDPAHRIAALQTGMPHKLIVLRTMDGSRSFEAALHRHFDHLRVCGEWFTHSNEMLGDLEFLRDGSSMPRSFANDADPIVWRVVEAAGGTAALASILGIRAPSIYAWRQIPPLRARAIEAATGIPRCELRPDIWPPEQYPRDTTPPAAANDAAASPSKSGRKRTAAPAAAPVTPPTRTTKAAA